MPAWLIALDRHVTIRYLVMMGCGALALLGSLAWCSFGDRDTCTERKS